MPEIRVTFSGLISMGIGLVTVLTGIVFTMIVTRRLSPDEFGAWSLIGSLIVYAVIIEPIIAYWTTREIARDEKSGKTALISSGIFSIGGILIFFIASLVISDQTTIDQHILFVAILLVPLMFINRTLTAINLGSKPHAESYGILAFEIGKIPMGLILVYFLDLGLEGALYATILSYFFSIIVLFFHAKEEIKHKINFKFLKKWLKLSWIPIYPGLATVIMVSDVVVVSILTGTTVGLAYWATAFAIASLIMHAGKISRAVYPKLLQSGKIAYFNENLNLVFYFSIPLFAVAVTFAKPGLFALNPIYENGWPIVIFLSIRVFLELMGRIFNTGLVGMDKVDVKDNGTFKKYIHSSIVHVNNIRLIHQVSYLGIVAVFFYLITEISQLESIIYWSIIAMLVQLPFTVYYIYLWKKEYPLKINKLPILKYIIVAFGMFSLIYFLMEEYLIYEIEIIKFMPNLLLFVGIGISGYFVLSYIVDKRARKLINQILNEINPKK